MGRTIKVDPKKLKSAASQIDAQANEYKRQYEQLFTEVSAMASAWQGADNLAFTTQIEGFREDFTVMYQLMLKYSEFLKLSADLYQGTQDEVTTQAKRLTN